MPVEKELNLSQFITYSVIILVGCLAAEFFLFALSLRYEVYENMVCWYFPIGFRLLLLLYLPIRYWGVVWFGGSLGLFLYWSNYVEPNTVFIDNFSYNFYFLLSLCFFVWLYC